MRRARISSSVAIAALAHAAPIFALNVGPLPRLLAPAFAGAPIVDEPLIDTEVAVLSAAPATPMHDTAQAPNEPATLLHRATPLPTSSPRVAPPLAHDVPSAADEGPLSVVRPTQIDLGIGTYWKRVAMTGDPTQAPPGDRAPPRSPVGQMLRDDLDARDRARGLGGAGAIISAAREAASATIAPDVGSATFDIESDAAGRIVTARLVTAARDIVAWNAVAREVVRLMSTKTVRVRPGACGVRARVSVTAMRVPPSGNKNTVSAGAVPDDVPGSDPVCEGEGAQRRCTAGLPVGITANSVDVANAGANAVRVVRVQLLSEVGL